MLSRLEKLDFCAILMKSVNFSEVVNLAEMVLDDIVCSQTCLIKELPRKSECLVKMLQMQDLNISCSELKYTVL